MRTLRRIASRAKPARFSPLSAVFPRYFLLLESGDFLLLESGDNLILDVANG